LCRKCQDIVRIFDKKRTCKCGECSGYYDADGVNATFVGEHVCPIGIGNSKLLKAVQISDIENKHQKEPTTCQGIDFKAFVMLDCSTTITVKNE